MQAIIVGLIGAVLSLGAIMGYAEYEQNLGALPLIQSAQLAASPSNGECLSTNGTINDWTTCGVGGGLTTYDAWTHPIAGVSATTTPIRFTGGFFASSTVLIDNSTTTNATTTSLAILNLTAASCDVKASTAGVLSCGTDASGSGSGMATTSIDTESELETILTDVTNVFTNNDTIGTANGGTGISNPGSLATDALLVFNDSSGATEFTPGADGTILKSTALGSAFTMGSLDLADTDAVGTSILAIANGGTGWANIQSNAIPYGNGTTRLSTTTQGTAGQVLGLVGGVPTWVATSSSLSFYDAWSHPASGQSATTSLLFMAGLVSTASSTINGNLNILGNATATNATTTNLYVTNPPVFSTLTSALLLTGSTGLLAEYTGIGCTNQVVEDVSALGAGTCVSINNGYWSGTDLSVANGGTGLSTFGGTNTVLYTTAADTLSSEASFTYDAAQDLLTVASTSITKATSTNLTVTATASSSALVISNNIRLFGGTVYSTLASLGAALVNAITAATPTGTWDFGGATSLEIVNAAAPTVDATGELAWDTTSGQMKIYDGSATRVLATGYDFSTFTYSTSTAWAGTTTVPLGPSYFAETWNGIKCFTDTGTVQVSLNDGTNRMDFLNSSTTVGTVALTSNNTFTAGEKRYVDLGTPASSPKSVSCTVSRSITAD